MGAPRARLYLKNTVTIKKPKPLNTETQSEGEKQEKSKNALLFSALDFSPFLWVSVLRGLPLILQ
jgi:hypothetical protein